MANETESTAAKKAPYIWPCASTSITQYWGNAQHNAADNSGTPHSGMDIGERFGEPIWAVRDGYVFASGYGVEDGSYGNSVCINHRNGVYTRYAHLNSIAVRNGQEVKQGQIIGYCGKTGNVTGVHLHLEFRLGGQWGTKVNPLNYISPSNNRPTAGTTPNQTAADMGGLTVNTGATGPQSLEITDIEIVGGKRNAGVTDSRPWDTNLSSVIKDGPELIINNGKEKLLPIIQDSITLQRPRAGAPSTLKFKIINDGKLKIDCGNAVSFKWNGVKMFYGFIFTLKASDTNTLDVTAYDQLRYLKNEYSYNFKNTTFTNILKTLCKDYGLRTGALDDTKQKITIPIGEQSGLDWIDDASSYTVRPGSNGKSGSEYVVFDDFGKVTLKEMVPWTSETKKVKDPQTGKEKTETKIKEIKMLSSCFVDNDEIEGFTWEKSIDDQSNTSNQLILAYDDDSTGKRKIHIYNDGPSQSKYGTLSEYNSRDTWSDAKSREYYVKIWKGKRLDPSKRFSAKGVAGAPDVRGGSYVIVQVRPGRESENTNTFMLVEDAKHTFKDGRHTMDLTLRGGQYDV